MESKGPAGRHRGPEPGGGVHAGADQRVEPRVLRRPAEQGCPGVLARTGAVHLAGVRLHRHCGLPVLPDPVAGDALAGLDDGPLSGPLAGQQGLLPDGDHPLRPRRRRPAGQPGPADCRGHEPVHELFGQPVHGTAQRAGDPGEFCGHPLVALGQFCLRLERPDHRDPGLHGLDGRGLLRAGQRGHPLHRSPANRPELRTAAA